MIYIIPLGVLYSDSKFINYYKLTKMKILLTGGAGFIGSHTLIELVEAGHDAVVVDNLYNASPISLQRVAKIIGKEVPFYKVDIRDREGLQKVFDEHKFDA